MERILDRRHRRYGRGSREEFLVKWLGWDYHECTWEPREHLQNPCGGCGSSFDANVICRQRESVSRGAAWSVTRSQRGSESCGAIRELARTPLIRAGGM